jgi:hypothetical protein
MPARPRRPVVNEWVARVGHAALAAIGVRRIQPAGLDPEQFVELCAALHRLDGELARLRHCDRRTPALYHRLSSATLAYDAVLRDTGRAIGLPVPTAVPFAPVSRLEVEAALAAAGVRW